MKPVAGVYHLRHIASGKVYSGKTNNLSKQQRYHYALLSSGKHKSPECQALYDVNKDPKEFTFDIEVCQDMEQAERVLLLRLKEARENGTSLNSTRFQLDAPNKGVYQILFPDGSFYIGSTKDIRGRIATHDWSLRMKKHKNKNVQDKFDIHGTFTCVILEHTGDNYRELENKYLLENYGKPECLNLASDAFSPTAVLWRSEEYRAKQDELREKRWSTEGAKEEYSKKMKAYWAKPEAKAARSGGNNPFAKKISVDGIVYGSFATAVREIPISRRYLENRLKDEKDTAVFYL